MYEGEHAKAKTGAGLNKTFLITITRPPHNPIKIQNPWILVARFTAMTSKTRCNKCTGVRTRQRQLRNTVFIGKSYEFKLIIKRIVQLINNEITKIHRCGFRITRAAISRNSNSCAFNDKLVSPPESRSPGCVAQQAVIECPTVAILGLMAAGLISPSSRLGPDYSRCAPLSNTALYNNGRRSEVGFQHQKHARSSPDNTNRNQINQKLLN